MENMTRYDEPLTGIQTAQLSWDLPDGLLQELLLNVPQISTIYADVRDQFALWAATQPNARFENLADAWNQFITPRGGVTRPAVLLPGTNCYRCRRFRYSSRINAHAKQTDCRECQGTGKKAPRAVYASYARVVPITHLMEADLETGT